MLKIKTLLFIAVLSAFATAISAAPVIDSVGVKNNDGKKMVLFKVKAKDTYYSIAHKYHLKPEALMKFNGAKKPALSIGAVVEVPTELPFKKSKESSETASKKSKKEAEPSEKVAKSNKKETKTEKKQRLAKEQEEADEKERKEARAAKRRERKENAEKPEQTEQPETTVAEQPERTPPPVQQPAPQPAPVNNAPPIQYKVSQGETLYAISKRFNMSVDDLQKLNNLSSNNIQPGQVLMVRSSAGATPPPAPIPAPVVVQQTQMPVAKRDSSTPVTPMRDSSSTEKHNGSTRFGLYEKNEKGVATWIDDTSLDPNKKLVLHRTAPIGTVIKITNPMTNRTTFAKVVGRFTDTEATKDVIIVMTKNVADSLGALDKRFHVSISYGSPVE